MAFYRIRKLFQRYRIKIIECMEYNLISNMGGGLVKVFWSSDCWVPASLPEDVLLSSQVTAVHDEVIQTGKNYLQEEK